MSTQVVGTGAAGLTPLSASSESQSSARMAGLARVGDHDTAAMADRFADVLAPAPASAPAGGQPAPQREITLSDMLALAGWLMPGPVRLEPIQDIALTQGAGEGSPAEVVRLGAEVARQLGMDASGYSAAELAALGEEVILDQLLSGDVRGFVGALQPPTRAGLARQLLLDLGLDPERLVETPQLIDPENPLAENERRQAAHYYFNRDSLSATELRWMSDRPLSDAEVQHMLDQLPASLDAQFGKRFDAYANGVSTRLSGLLENWVSSLVRQHGIDPTTATVTLSRATLRYYTGEVDVNNVTAVRYDKTQAEIDGHGYFVSIQAAGTQHRYFLSTKTCQAYALPTEGGPNAWITDHRDTVFDKTLADALVGGRQIGMENRVVTEQMGSGALGAMRQWLAPVFSADVEKGRDAARGETPAESANDAFFNAVIPFRGMVKAFKKGDARTAYHMYLLSLLDIILALSTGANLAKGVIPLAHMGPAQSRAGGLMGLQRMGIQLPGIGQSIRMGGTTMDVASKAWRRLRPLDTERIAAAVRPVSPKLAEELEKVVARARGATMMEGTWKIPDGSTTALVPGNAIDAAQLVKAQGHDGAELTLLPYGSNGRTYTQYDSSSGERTGAVLLADSDGWLHQTLPMTVLERYRVTTSGVLQALAGRRAGADGTIMLDDRHYLRIGEDYVESTPDMAVSTDEHLIWRVVAPDGVSPDIIAHRLAYDGDKALWRRAKVPELKGGGPLSFLRNRISGNRIYRTPISVARVGPTAVEQARFLDTLVQGIRGGATEQQAEAVRGLLDRLRADASGDAILRAMWGFHESLGETPEIVLRHIADAASPTPAGQALSGNVWHLDPNALPTMSTAQAVRELVDVYKNMTTAAMNMTGQLGSIFDKVFAEGKLIIDRELEERWSRWIAEGKRIGGDEHPARKRLITNLRKKLCAMRFFGGASERMLLHHDIMAAQDTALWAPVSSIPPLPPDINVIRASRSHLLGFTQGDLWNDRAFSSLRHSEIVLADSRLYQDSMELPAGLKVLSLAYNAGERLWALPAGLRMLRVYEGGLTRLPDSWPPGLEVLDLTGCPITEFPTNLPAGLRILRLAKGRLTQLPDTWPPGLEVLDLSGNRITDFPRNLPAGLRKLHLDQNLLTQLPASINTLTDCEIFIEGNPIALENIPQPAEGQPGPRIHFSMPGSGVDTPSQSGAVAQAVQEWLDGRPEVASLWDSIEAPIEAAEFCRFLDRLRGTIMYRDAAQRSQVAEWLAELAKPERAALRADTFVLCFGATQTCDDRVVSTWQAVKRLQLNDDIRIGRYDDRPDDVVQAARQMFRLQVLEEVARRKASALRMVDEVEVHLAYAVKLKDELALTTVVPEMLFFNVSGVTADDLAQALRTVRARERDEFGPFLVVDYEPWQTLLKRKDPAAYAAAEEALHELVETRFEQRLQDELAKLGLDPADADADAIADARKDLGPRIMRELQYRQFEPLTRKTQSPQGAVLPLG